MLEFGRDGQSDGKNPVYLVDQDAPGDSAQGEFAFRPQYSKELDQPYSFAITRIAGGSLTVEEHLGRDGDRTRTLARVDSRGASNEDREDSESSEENEDSQDGGTATGDVPQLEAYDDASEELWAFDIDHDFTSTWTLSPELNLDAREPNNDDELGETQGDEAGGDDLGSTQDRELGGAEDEDQTEDEKLGETDDANSDDAEENRKDDGDDDDAPGTEAESDAAGSEPADAPLQRICVAVESRSTDERADADGSPLVPNGARSEQVLTFVFGDHDDEIQTVAPCAEDPEAFTGERKLEGPNGSSNPLLPEEMKEFDPVIPKMDALDDESEIGSDDAGTAEDVAGDGGVGEGSTDEGAQNQEPDPMRNVRFQHGPGLDFTSFAGAGNDWAGVRFQLFDAPEEAALVYRNSNRRPPGIFHEHGYNERMVREDQTSDVYHRPIPTRDAHASWGFTKNGVYCLAVGVRTFAYGDQALGSYIDEEPTVSKIIIGNVREDVVESVSCEDPPEIEFPATPEPGPGDQGSGGDDDSEDTGVNGKVPTDDSGDGTDPGMNAPGSDPTDDGMNAPGSDPTDDGMNAPGSNPSSSEGAIPTQGATPSPTESTPATRVQQAPPVIRPCPATMNSEVQVRDGRLNLTAGVQGAGLTAEFVDMRRTPAAGVGTSATVVIPDRATRTVTSSLDSFADEGTTVWATETLERGSVPLLGWDLTALSDTEVSGPVTVSVQRVEGPGHFAILSEESGLLTLLADTTNSADLDAGSEGIGAFAFTQPGTYTVTLDLAATSRSGQQLGPTSVKLNFVVGDTNTAASDSPMLRALLGECAGMAVATDIMDYAGEPQQPQQAAPDLNQAQEGILGDTWWVIAGVTLGVAALLGLAVLIVLMRESRR